MLKEQYEQFDPTEWELSTRWYFNLKDKERYPLSSSKDIQERVVGELQILQASIFMAEKKTLSIIFASVRMAMDLKRFDYAAAIIDKVLFSANGMSPQLAQYIGDVPREWGI